MGESRAPGYHIGGTPSVAVVVLGDLGRSPRMLAHVRSLASAGLRVDLIGYDQSPLPRSVAEHPSVTLHPIVDRWGSGPGILRLLSLSGQLTRILLGTLSRPAVLLVQNPPAIPTLALALLGARSRGARLVLDWHNFGCSMLALRRRTPAVFLRAARSWEVSLGRRADAHLCVTEAMRERLGEEWGIPGARVLADRRRADWERPDREAARARMARILPGQGDAGAVTLVTATSWSLDEDMEMCLEALQEYATRRCAGLDPLRPLRVILSGRGPGREAFERKISGLHLAGVRIETAWVSPEDYPWMLRAADLGLCFHRSASGVDFPMKIVDMRAAGLPVLAYDYGPSLREEVGPDRGGRVFVTAAGLADNLTDLCAEGEESHERLSWLRSRAEGLPDETWEAAWDRVARPLFLPGEAAR